MNGVGEAHKKKKTTTQPTLPRKTKPHQTRCGRKEEKWPDRPEKIKKS